MPRIDQNGNMEFHQTEMPAGYQCMADPENPFKRAEEKEIISKRKCKCGKAFILHVEYDPENPLHSLCDSCILELPVDPDKRYVRETIQMMSEPGDQIGEGA